MSVFDYDKNRDNRKPFHASGMAENAARRATDDNQDKYAKQDNTPSGGNEEHYSLNDDRRVKVLSPGALVAKRFFRNRLAVVGLSILIFMFVFSFIGGLLSPYGEDEFFYRDDQINKEFAVVTENSDFRYMAKDSALFGSPVQAQTMLAIQKSSETFSYGGNSYTLTPEGTDFYSVSSGGKVVGIAYKDVVSSSTEGQALSFEFVYTALKSYAALEQELENEAAQETAGASEATGATDDAPADTAEPVEPDAPAVKSFTVDGIAYTIDEDGGVLQGDKEVAYISRYIVQAIMPDIFLSRDFKEKLIDTIAAEEKVLPYLDIPIQHCNDKVLEAMNRRGDKAELLALFRKLRGRIPGLVLRTSLITGLPYEDEAAFEELCDFLREVRIERAGVFPYSPEEGTPAARMLNRVDTAEAERRAELVVDVQSRIMDDFNDSRMGTVAEVLCDGFDSQSMMFVGRSYAESPDIDGRIYFTADHEVEAGEFVPVRITGAMDGELTGQLAE